MAGAGWLLAGFLLALVGFCLLRLAGSRPGGRPTFLLHDRSAGHKKLGEKTCPAASVPESFALRIFRGNLRSE